MSLSRRRFLRTPATGAVGASAALWTPPAYAAGRQATAPRDRIVMGAIGVNGMGFSNARSLPKQPGVECAALCDSTGACWSAPWTLPQV